MMMMSDVRAGIFGGFSEWWHNLRTAWNEVDELKRCGRETENIARDVGLSTSELYTIAAKRPDAANQVRRRLEALHLDRDELLHAYPRVARDLERTCTLCGAKRQCERDLASRPDDPVWRSYCPNAHTLKALQEDQRRKADCSPETVQRAAFPASLT